MARNTAAMKRGWNYDYPNTRLCAMVDGLEVLRLDPPTTAGETLVAQFGVTTSCPTQVKVHNRDASTASALEVRHRTTSNTPSHYGIDSITYMRPGTAMTSGLGYAGFFQVRLDSTYTMTGGYLEGIHVECSNQGTINGGGVVFCAINGTVPANSGTFTALSIYTPLWLDWKETKAVTSGTTSMMFLSHNGSTVLSSIFHIDAAEYTTYLMDLSEAGTMVSSNNAGDATFANWKSIKVLINGTIHYLIAAQTIS